MKIDRVLQWLDCVGEDLTLVGGQAVALWEHVLDCLASRLSNITLIPGKRTSRGYDQLRATIQVCHGHLLRLIAEGKGHEAIKIANRVFDLALTDAGKRTFFHQGIDLLDTLPAPAAFGVDAFEHENHPRQVQRVRLQREQFARFFWPATEALTAMGQRGVNQSESRFGAKNQDAWATEQPAIAFRPADSCRRSAPQ